MDGQMDNPTIMIILTHLLQFQCLFSLGNIVSVFLEARELALEDGQGIGGDIWLQISL